MELLEKLTNKYYDDYKTQIDFDGLTHSVYCEMTTALLNKQLKRYWEMVNGEAFCPPPHRISAQAKIDAIIKLVTEISVIGATLMLNEPIVEFDEEDEW
jgi:hypothetical protein